MFSVPEKKGKKLKQTEIEVKIIVKMKRHVFINPKFMLKVVNRFHQVMSDTDKQRYFLVSLRT